MKVLFDLDDKLINHSQAEIDAAIKFGDVFATEIPNYDKDTFAKLWKKTSQIYMNDFLAQKITFNEQRILRIRTIFQNDNISEFDALDLFDKYLNFYEHFWSVFPDVIDVLDFLKQNNVEMAILSDGSQQQQEQKLLKTGIYKYFKFVLTAETENMSKPNIKFFNKGAKLLGGDKKDVFYVGDNLQKDAIGASQAGLSGVWLNRNKLNCNYEPTISNLSELKDLLSKS